MKETKLYSKLRPRLTDWGTCDRVENTLGSGMSDVFYNIEGCVGWIETKVAKGDDVYFEKFQPNWMRKHVRHGFPNMFVVVMDRHESIHLYRSSEVVYLPVRPYNDWLVMSLSDFPEPLASISAPYRNQSEWEAFRLVLIS